MKQGDVDNDDDDDDDDDDERVHCAITNVRNMTQRANLVMVVP